MYQQDFKNVIIKNKTFTGKILGNKDFLQYLLSNHFWANDSVISKLSKELKVGFLIINDKFTVEHYEHKDNTDVFDIDNFIILHHHNGNHYKYI